MDPESFLLGTLIVSLALYALLGGADFGAGIWEFNTALGAPKRERELLYRAIGPVWEANHVWLIFALVVAFTAFPPAFAAFCRALWLPLLLALLGIVFRGSAFAFRASLAPDGSPRRWEALFAVASTAAPFFLGASAWAVASGRLLVTPAGDFIGDPLAGWVNGMSIFGGFFAVATCSYLAAVYLARDAHLEKDEDLTALWRRRALATGAWMGVLSAAGLALVAKSAPHLWEGFRGRATPLVVLSAAGGLVSLIAMGARRYTVAVLGAGAAVSGVVLGWGVAQYPAILPPTITIEAARAPQRVMLATAWSIAGGTLLLVPSVALLFILFKGKRPSTPSSG